MTPPTKKLIEVALPLPEINDASAYDKMPGIGPHPKGIHHWWARLPLPTARAVLFASVVDDPSAHPDKFKTEAAQERERERLFGILRRMMQKKLHEHPEVYAEARAEMLKSCGGNLPPVFDPFAGGGSIPLEANRLGFEAHAGDLNPVAVLLNKCNLEIAPRWAGHPPVNPQARVEHTRGHVWRGTHGLAEDVRYYGRKIREQAQEKIGHLYPKVKLPKEYGGGDANVVAWLWARTVASPNPAAKGAHVPLISTYWLNAPTKKKKLPYHWLNPVVDKAKRTYGFEVKAGEPSDRKAVRAGTKVARATFNCILTGTPLSNVYINEQASKSALGFTLLAVIADGGRRKVYLPANDSGETASAVIPPADVLTEAARGTFAGNAMGLPYGFTMFRHYFTPRQLTTLVTLSDLVKENHAQVLKDAQTAGVSDAAEYAKAVTTFLALAVDRTGDFNNSLCRWSPTNQKVMNLFSRQAIPMVWDLAEANTMGDSVGAWSTCSDYVAECVEVVGAGKTLLGHAAQVDAANALHGGGNLLVSTDPPYYDNISYAALSDFFYVWLRRTAGQFYPDLFSTVLVPKLPELSASPASYEGDKDKAKEHFESGFRKAFTALRERLDPRFPLTVYYAFKQDDEEEGEEVEDGGGASAVDLTTGWETLLEALVSSGFQITGTWPVRASQKWRQVSMGTNSLASYIVLACRPRSADAKQVGRREFLAELKKELPMALRLLQQGNIAPVDFAQAAIGPGMAVFSRYSRIIENDGQPMTVRTALGLINQIKEEVIGEPVEEYDIETRWAVTWFDQHGFAEADYGEAELLAKTQAVSVGGLADAGILKAKAGKVRLWRPEELPKDWDPATDKRLTVWEMTHHLLRVYYHEKAGDAATGEMLRKLGSKGEVARDLAYRLFSLCERRKRSQEAQAYNALVLGWPAFQELSQKAPVAEAPRAQQQEFRT
jgi:putative DNA methylase